MKKMIKLFGGLAALAGIMVLASCGDDDPAIGGGGSVPVADGFYLAKVGETPTSATGLVPEKVEASGFGSQDRDGYFANYMVLEAGEYNLVSVIDQEISATLGGADAEADSTGNSSDIDELDPYTLVDELEEDGPTFTVASDGFYKVFYDNSQNELVLYKIVHANLIGAASPAGWSHNANQIMPVDIDDATGEVSFSISDVVMRPGDFKLRFNARWVIDRRVDPTISQDIPTNGYVAFTNLGGTLAAPVAGGANYSVGDGEDGEYTITLTWNSDDGFEVTATNDNPLPPITFNPENFAWGIIGPASPAAGWDSDVDLNYQGVSSNTYTWQGTFTMTTGDFKFRINNAWDYAPNANSGTWTVTGPDAANVNATGSDFNMTVAGSYVVVITTSDDGDSWTVSFDKQ